MTADHTGTVHAGTSVNTVRMLRAAHYARVDGAVALQREGILGEDSPDGLAEALEVLGIRPPDSYVDELRRRYPNLAKAAEATPDTLDERDVLRRLHARALYPYAEDLLENADAIAALELDPMGAAEQLGDLDGLVIGVAHYAAGLLEDYRERYDALIGESFAPTHSPA